MSLWYLDTFVLNNVLNQCDLITFVMLMLDTNIVFQKQMAINANIITLWGLGVSDNKMAFAL